PFGDSREESVADLYVMGQKADALGIFVDENSVDDFIRNVTGDKVAASTIRGILTEIGGHRAAVWTDLVAALQLELKALRVRELLFDADKLGELPGQSMGGLPRTSPLPVPPGMRWQMYREMSQTVTAELLPVAADSLLGDVGKPSEKELADFFDR